MNASEWLEIRVRGLYQHILQVESPPPLTHCANPATLEELRREASLPSPHRGEGGGLNHR
jgi:hypothetical protein